MLGYIKRNIKYVWTGQQLRWFFLFFGLLSACTLNPPSIREAPQDQFLPWEATELSGGKIEGGVISIATAPGLDIGSVMFSQKDRAILMYVPEGDFRMGSNQWRENESPIHTVYLDAFWVYQTEVTIEMYAGFLNEMGNQSEGGATWLKLDRGNYINLVDGIWQAESGLKEHPVQNVRWYGAQAYCEWAGGRLPTEAEWEKAARGTDERSYPWGEGIDPSLANYFHLAGGVTPVGSYPEGASPYGALDMAGNAIEWVLDWYEEDYYNSLVYDNPQGPVTGTNKGVRGGDGTSTGDTARTSYRFSSAPYSPAGFRCVFTP